jgi:Peptidase family C25
VSTLVFVLSLFAADAEPADTVVVCPKEFVAALNPLLAHRHAQGHRFVYVPNTWSADEIRNSIRTTAKGGKLRAILLVGDAEPAADTDPLIRARCVPAHRAAAKINVKFGSEPEIGTDNWYADLDDDEVPDLAIGRLPADSRQELTRIVDKILAYETTQSHGLWRQRVNFVAGVGGFGGLLDGVIETSTKKLLTDGIPAAYRTNMTFGSWRSAYCPDPRRFHETAVARHNEGCLFWVYIGHGQPTGLDQVQVPGSRFHIFNCDDCGKLQAKNGSPIAIMLACYTAAYDRGTDCLAEDMLRAPGGPVAIYGGSRVTMPYAMAVMSSEMLEEYFQNKPATLGQAVLQTKRRMVTPVDEKNAQERPNRLLLDALASILSPARATLTQERHEHLHLFNLIGDPNLTLSYPGEVKLELQGDPLPGKTVELTAESPLAGRVTIELLARRDISKVNVPPRDHFDPSNAGLAAWQTAYEQANDQVWLRKVVPLESAGEEVSRLTEQLQIPELARGPAHLRVFVEGPQGHAVGVLNIVIKPAKKVEESAIRAEPTAR